MLWHWLKLTVITRHKQRLASRSGIRFLYEKMGELVKAAHKIRGSSKK
jgi:hypothetical protein